MGFDYQSLALGQFQMPDGWKLTSIQEVAKVNEKAITPKIAPSHIRYIDIASVDKGKLLDIQEIPFKKAPSRARRVVRDNDSLISTVRPNLEHYLFVKEPEPNTIASTGFAVVSAKAVDPRFLYYYMTSKPFTAYLTQIAESHTSAYPAFNPDVIEQAELILPKDDEQRAIAHILGSLDDKVELNRRMNQTLEAMARGIFKSWFVDFDPVRAKAEGGDPGLPDDIAALFPDSFEPACRDARGAGRDSELGEIPKGWNPSTIGSEFNLTMGQSPPGKSYNETGNGLPFFQGRRDFGFRYPSNRVYCSAPQRLADHGDTLVSVRAPVGDINMAIERCCIGRGVAGIRHKSRSRSYTYYAMHTLSDRFVRFEAEGTVFGAINKKQFEELRWLSPGENLVSDFEKIAYAFDEQIERNTNESTTLKTLRNMLLPKLISGELRVPDAEKFVEEAGV